MKIVKRSAEIALFFISFRPQKSNFINWLENLNDVSKSCTYAQHLHEMQPLCNSACKLWAQYCTQQQHHRKVIPEAELCLLFPGKLPDSEHAARWHKCVVVVVFEKKETDDGGRAWFFFRCSLLQQATLLGIYLIMTTTRRGTESDDIAFRVARYKSEFFSQIPLFLYSDANICILDNYL